MKKNLTVLLFASALLTFAACDPDRNTPVTPTTNKEDNLGVGNPSGATADVANEENYLITKPQYILSYNRTKETANWVAWHLSSDWKGTAVRQDVFKPDPDLPTGWYRVTTGNYTGTGFDRGHICPSDDRDGTQTDNDATFYMTNMMPQSPNLNRITWERLEAYCRTLVTQGNECYIVAGPAGQGGEGSNSTTIFSTLDNGHITIPESCWKVVIVLPVGTSDLTRIKSSTRVIAVVMPNRQSVSNQSWGAYRTSVRTIESLTGFNFFTKLPQTTQDAIETSIDAGPTS
jgi:endonuclease G, mitochondrial